MRFPGLAIFAALALACTPHRDEPPVVVDASPVVDVAPREPVTIEVLAEWPGQGVIEIERSLVVPLERALQGAADVTRIDSHARVNGATIVLTLDPRADPGRARVEVHERLGAARASLPDDVVPVIAADLAPPASALVFVLTSTTADSMQLHRAAQALRDALVVLPGVGQVETCGGHEAGLIVALDPARLSAYRLSVPAVVQALTSGLRDELLPGGISVAGARDLEALMAILVARGEHPVALRDIASVAVEPELRECMAVHDGAPAVVGLVRALRGAELSAVHAAVRAELAAKRSEFAARGFDLEVPAASPLRLALDLPGTTNPGEALARAHREIAGALAAGGPSFTDRLAVVHATTSMQVGILVEGELLLDTAGLGRAELVALERRLANLPGLGVRGPLEDPSRLSFRVTGDELEVDRRLAVEAARLAAQVPGVLRAVARDDQHPGMVLELRRERLADLGLSVNDLRVTLAAVQGGAPAGHVAMDGTRLPVRVHVGERTGDRTVQPAVLPALEIVLPAGGTARLDELVDIRVELDPGTISRVDGRRAITVEVRVDVPTPALRAALQRALATSLQLPPGYTLVWE